MRIQSGDASVGGTKAWITSEFAVAHAAGDPDAPALRLLRRGGRRHDDHPGRRVAARRAAARHPAAARASTSGASSSRCSSAPLVVLAIHLAAMIFFNHVLPNAEAQGHPRAVPLAQLPAAGLAVLAADDRLPGGGLVLRRRADAPPDPGLLAAGRGRCSLDVFFLWTGRRAGSTRGSTAS